MQTLPIMWQRLVSGGNTCDRCAATHTEVEDAVATLTQVLAPIGIQPVLEIREIDSATFKEHPSESNRVFIAGRRLEEWLDASVGHSRCSSVRGDADCRTVEVGSTTFEAMPKRTVVRAALIAAAQILADS